MKLRMILTHSVATLVVLMMANSTHAQTANTRELAYAPRASSQEFSVAGDERGCPGPGDCFELSPSPGCNDTLCCNLVCGQERDCCNDEWGGLCVDVADVPPNVVPLVMLVLRPPEHQLAGVA